MRFDSGQTGGGYDPYAMIGSMPQPTLSRRKSHPLWRLLVEVTFIMFLFYSNLLMGEFTGTNGRGKTLAFAIHDIFTPANFTIALISAMIGYVVFEFWRKKLS